jgi:hypothetical protein
VFEPSADSGNEHPDFTSRGIGYDVIFQRSELTIQLPSETPNYHGTAIQFKFASADPNARLEALDQEPGVTNYLSGRDRTRWRTHVPRFTRLRIRSLYPGIDLVYHGSKGELEYDLVLSPHADSSRIHIQVVGAQGLRLDRGALIVQTASGDLSYGKPFIYQETWGGRMAVEGHYVLLDTCEVGFHLEDFDHTKPLVIDPTLTFSSFTGAATTNAMAVDAAGNIYIAGSSYGSRGTASVTKLDPTGSRVVYTTYLGDVGAANGIVVDSSGHAYVAGSANSFPVVNPLPETAQYKDGAFVAELSATGDAPVFSTVLGSGGIANAVALDAQGNLYVGGFTTGSKFPVKNAYQAAPPGAGQSADGFVVKINPTTSSLAFGTYFGGSGDDYIKALTVDPSGNIWVTGSTSSADFPQAKSLQGAGVPPTYNNGVLPVPAVFVAKFDSTGGLLFSTFLGSTAGGPTSSSSGQAIVSDSAGNVYVAGGNSGPGDFLFTGQLQDYSDRLGLNYENCFVTKFSNAGTILFSTLLPAWTCSALAVAPNGRIGVAGTSPVGSVWQPPPLVDPVQSTTGSWGSGAIYVLEADGSRIDFSSNLGGLSGQANLNAIAFGADGSLYVAGYGDTGYPQMQALPLGHTSVASRITLGTTCTFQVSPTSFSVTSANDWQYGLVRVTAPDGCVWNAIGPAVLGYPAPGGDNGNLHYYESSGSDYVILAVDYGGGYVDTVQHVLIAGQKVTLNFAKSSGWNCSYNLGSSSSQNFNSYGGFSKFQVDTPSGCPLAPSTNASWITVQAAYLSPWVYFNVAPNFGPARQATVAVGSSNFTVTQDAYLAPVLTIKKSHSGSFLQGQTGAIYTIQVGDAAGAQYIQGTVTVTESVPAGLSLVSMTGVGWTCPSNGNTCTRTDSLTAGASFPPIVVTVNVSPTATSPQVNVATASGAGSATATDSDTTVILPSTAGPISVMPASGAGNSGQFRLSLTDLSGSGDIASAVLLLNSSLSGSGGCFVNYNATNNSLLLANDTVTAWFGPSAVGSGAALSNSQCTVRPSGASVATSGNTLTISIPVAFNPAFAGTKTIWGFFSQKNGATSSYQVVGAWKVLTAAAAASRVAAYNPTSAVFLVDTNGDFAWSGQFVDSIITWGPQNHTPKPVVVTGDWNGSGTKKIGVFDPGSATWFLDYDGDGVYTPSVDKYFQWGSPGDIPVVGDWNGSGSTKVGTFGPNTGLWLLDYNGNFSWDGPATDRYFPWGSAGDTPVVGDWNGSGTAKVGTFGPKTGLWLLDYNGNSAWDGPGTDKYFPWGSGGDTPVVGDWNGSGTTKVGTFGPKTGLWLLDYNGNGGWEGPGVDKYFAWGSGGDTPVVGDWNGSGSTKVGTVGPGTALWLLDYNGNYGWDGAGVDKYFSWGSRGDTPVVVK